MKRIYLLLFGLSCLLLTGCMKKHIDWQFHVNSTTIPSCYETNRNIFGEFTGQAFLCGDLVFYSQYTYERDNYTHKRTDGLYVRTLNDSFTVKLADGIIHSIVVREDGVYYLKLHEKGKIFLYNFDLYRYNFESRKNELVVEDCSFVQFSDDSVYYCPHYLSDKSSYVKYGAPLNLENEGKIVKHSLLTGEEQVVAQVDGNIYHFLVGENAIAFAGGEGSHYYGGQTLYICDLDGGNLRQLTDYDNRCFIRIVYADAVDGTLIYWVDIKDGSGYHCLDLNSGKDIWEIDYSSLATEGPLYTALYCNRLLYSIKEDSSLGENRQILYMDSEHPQSTSLIDTPEYCESLFTFNNCLYMYNSTSCLIPVDCGQ